MVVGPDVKMSWPAASSVELLKINQHSNKDSRGYFSKAWGVFAPTYVALLEHKYVDGRPLSTAVLRYYWTHQQPYNNLL